MTSALPILWSFRRCPYAMRARLAIQSSGVAVHLREILLRDKPPAFIADSAKATVPVLRLPHGEVIDESLDVMHWALDQNDPEEWRRVLDDDPNFAKAYLAELDGSFKATLDRYKYSSRYDNGTEEALSHRTIGVNFLERIDQRLSQQSYLSGKKAGFLDFASLPFIRQFRIADPEWFDQQDWPYLHPWLINFLKSSDFAGVMKKYKPWAETGGDGLWPW
jgi:glutathione S-transferase